MQAVPPLKIRRFGGRSGQGKDSQLRGLAPRAIGAVFHVFFCGKTHIRAIRAIRGTFSGATKGRIRPNMTKYDQI